MPTPALLDANVLVALATEDHVHHDRARRWFGHGHAFATCPLTQLALVRLLMIFDTPAATAAEVLATLVANPRHEFWSDDLPVDGSLLGRVVGHRQVTDAYLVALATHRGGRLVTLDEGLVATYPDVGVLA